MAKLFLSYRRDDSADTVGRIRDRLVQHFGKNSVFTDLDSIPPGFNFVKYIDKQVAQCDIFLAAMGPDWISILHSRQDDEKDLVRIEIESALKRDIPVIPLLVQGGSVPTEGELPSSLSELASRQGVSVRRDPDFHSDVDRLIKKLDPESRKRKGRMIVALSILLVLGIAGFNAWYFDMPGKKDSSSTTIGENAVALLNARQKRSSPDALELSCGSRVDGTIEASAKSDVFTFTGREDEVVSITLVETDDFRGFKNARATLFSPARTGAGSSFDSNGQRMFTLPESGGYMIRVNANDFVSTGSYNLSLECIQPASPDAEALTCGDLISGSIDAPAGSDVFTFTGQADGAISITLVETDGFPGFKNARATLFSPTGTGVGSSFDCNGQRAFTLPESGSYTIRVNANDFVSMGTYNLGVTCL